MSISYAFTFQPYIWLYIVRGLGSVVEHLTADPGIAISPLTQIKYVHKRYILVLPGKKAPVY